MEQPVSGAGIGQNVLAMNEARGRERWSEAASSGLTSSVPTLRNLSTQAGAPSGRPAAPAGGANSYSVVVDEQGFQGLLEQSTTAPVLLVFYSRTRMPESGQLADDLATVVEEHEGRFLLGLVDIDAVPQIAQAMQIPSIPLVVAVVDGRPMPLLQDPLPIWIAAYGPKALRCAGRVAPMLCDGEG